MISFKQFSNLFGKKFVCLYVSQQSQKQLQQYATENGFNLAVDYEGNKQKPSNFDFHVTIFFTTTYHYTADTTVKLEKTLLKPSKFELLGKNHDVPVIKLEVTPELLKIRQMFIDQGYKDSWPDWKPHISLSYDKNSLPDTSNLKLPDFEIYADYLKISNQSG